MNCLCQPSRTVTLHIVLLDETDFTHEMMDELPGQTLLDIVFTRLNLIETTYFGLRYLDEENQTHWLDCSTRLSRQLKGDNCVYDLYFGVKFYAADPTKLIEEITRYQLFLQVKQDVRQGRLPVSFELAAELGALIIQSELGDYDFRRHSHGYVSEFNLMPNQSAEYENRITELHQQLTGMTPTIAELNYLDKVKWHDMYGVDLHPVLGEDSVEYYLGLTPSGVVVLRNKTTVAYYYWTRIVKAYFKGKYFMMRVCDKNNDVSTYGFETPRKSACRHLWRCCIEHHAFFRLVCTSPSQNHKGGSGDLFSLGFKFSYSGRTEKHVANDLILQVRTPPNFKRTPSKRQPRRSFNELNENSIKIIENNLSKCNPTERKSISIPQLAQAFNSSYRSTCIVPPYLSIHHQYAGHGNSAPDSPRSTRSAPWPRTQQKGLFGVTASPRSVRSANSNKGCTNVTSYRFRSSSLESKCSNDSKNYRRQKHKGRRTSDNESEISRGSYSGRSHKSHNSHRKHRQQQRSKHRRIESDSEITDLRNYHNFGHRKSPCSIENYEPNLQWHDGLYRHGDCSGISTIHQFTATKSSSSKHSSSNDLDNHSHGSNHRNRRHKKNKPTSDGPSRIWYNELAKHLQFDLVDTTGMTEDQLREIPYTKVETDLSKRTANSSAKVHTIGAKDRVDRIRGICLNESNSIDPTTNGSICSASTLSSKDCDKNSSLTRMMSSLSMGDFVSPSESCLIPLNETELRVSHEHTDSGLGADQDYAYSSERSSDSARYGTNKSSGTSVTSGNQNKIIHMGTSQDSVSNGKPPIHPHTQRNYIAPVHSSNNRLCNNTIFQNNQYTFSLSRNGDGYLDSRPYSAALLYDNERRVSRGTKSDIGAPTSKNRQQSSLSKSFLTNNNDHDSKFKGKMPSVKSDFLLSYLSHSSSCSSSNSTNNQSCSNTSAFHISNAINYSNYVTTTTATPSTTKILHSSSTNNQYNLQNRNDKPRAVSNVNSNSSSSQSNATGPLLYINNAERSGNTINCTSQIYQSMQSNPPSSEVLPAIMLMEMSQKSITSKPPTRTTSLELILTPIIQSSRRAQ